ncbi:MAG: hypothetical protein HGB19_13650, partial [Chlorobiales bacterium]|nr:hypothetical protein [Chlorobiales bacterium]
MKATALVFFLILFLFCGIRFVFAQTTDRGGQSSPQKDDDIRLISSSETSVTLEFRPSWRPVRQEALDGQTYTSYGFDLAESDPENAGLPMIPYRSLPILVGTDQTPRIEILAAESEPLTGINLLPVPYPDRKTTRWTYKAGEKYASFHFEKLAEASPIHHVRGYRMSYIRFYPLSYDAGTKTVKKYSRIQMRVSFGRFTDPSAAVQIKTLVQKDEPFVSSMINYETAKAWRKEVIRASTIKTIAASESVLGIGRFYKLACTDEGLYKLDKAYLESIGIDIATIDPRKIKIYYNGGEELPASLDAERISELRECAIYVDGQTDGQFDAADYVLFYIKGPQGVKYDVPKYPPSTSPGTDTSPRLTHYLNRQTTGVYAFLALDGDDGKRLTVSSSLQNSAPLVPQSFRTQVFVENERINFSGSGTDFFNAPLTTNLRNLTYQIQLPGIDKTNTVYYRMKAVSTGQRDLVKWFEDGRPLTTAYTG